MIVSTLQCFILIMVTVDFSFECIIMIEGQVIAVDDFKSVIVIGFIY